MSDYKKNLYTEDTDGIEFIDDYDDDDYDIDYDDDTLMDEEPSSYKPRKNSRYKEKPVTILSEVLSYVKIVVVAVVIAFIFTQFIIVNAQVPTGSMKNTIMEGDRLIGFRLSYLFSEPQRGDIVIFKFPDNENENYVKRIIGIPGDVIEITEGHVYVNGEMSSEAYLREPMISTETNQVYIVPEDCYFMMGDNRNSSADSRYWVNTFVNRKKILAKVVFRYYKGENKQIDFSLIK